MRCPEIGILWTINIVMCVVGFFYVKYERLFLVEYLNHSYIQLFNILKSRESLLYKGKVFLFGCKIFDVYVAYFLKI